MHTSMQADGADESCSRAYGFGALFSVVILASSCAAAVLPAWLHVVENGHSVDVGIWRACVSVNGALDCSYDPSSVATGLTTAFTTAQAFSLIGALSALGPLLIHLTLGLAKLSGGTQVALRQQRKWRMRSVLLCVTILHFSSCGVMAGVIITASNRVSAAPGVTAIFETGLWLAIASSLLLCSGSVCTELYLAARERDGRVQSASYAANLQHLELPGHGTRASSTLVGAHAARGSFDSDVGLGLELGTDDSDEVKCGEEGTRGASVAAIDATRRIRGRAAALPAALPGSPPQQRIAGSPPRHHRRDGGSASRSPPHSLGLLAVGSDKLLRDCISVWGESSVATPSQPPQERIDNAPVSAGNTGRVHDIVSPRNEGDMLLPVPSAHSRPSPVSHVSSHSATRDVTRGKPGGGPSTASTVVARGAPTAGHRLVLRAPVVDAVAAGTDTHAKDGEDAPAVYPSVLPAASLRLGRVADFTAPFSPPAASVAVGLDSRGHAPVSAVPALPLPASPPRIVVPSLPTFLVPPRPAMPSVRVPLRAAAAAAAGVAARADTVMDMPESSRFHLADDDAADLGAAAPRRGLLHRLSAAVLAPFGPRSRSQQLPSPSGVVDSRSSAALAEDMVTVTAAALQPKPLDPVRAAAAAAAAARSRALMPAIDLTPVLLEEAAANQPAVAQPLHADGGVSPVRLVSRKPSTRPGSQQPQFYVPVADEDDASLQCSDAATGCSADDKCQAQLGGVRDPGPGFDGSSAVSEHAVTHPKKEVFQGGIPVKSSGSRHHYRSVAESDSSADGHDIGGAAASRVEIPASLLETPVDTGPLPASIGTSTSSKLSPALVAAAATPKLPPPLFILAPRPQSACPSPPKDDTKKGTEDSEARPQSACSESSALSLEDLEALALSLHEPQAAAAATAAGGNPSGFSSVVESSRSVAHAACAGSSGSPPLQTSGDGGSGGGDGPPLREAKAAVDRAGPLHGSVARVLPPARPSAAAADAAASRRVAGLPLPPRSATAAVSNAPSPVGTLLLHTPSRAAKDAVGGASGASSQIFSEASYKLALRSIVLAEET